MLRWALYEAAVYAGRPSSPDHAYFQQVKARLGGQLALLSMARKLARRCLWVPRTASRPLTSAFSISQPRSQGPQPAQHDRPLWPLDSPLCCSPVC
jgi:hypothetical protein